MAIDGSMSIGTPSPTSSFTPSASAPQPVSQAVSSSPLNYTPSFRRPPLIQTPNGVPPTKTTAASSPLTPPPSGLSKRIMCCRNVVPHKAPINFKNQTTPTLPGEGQDNTLNQYSLLDFKEYAAGRFPDRLIIPAATAISNTPIPWTLYKLIFCVVSSASRGSHACKSIDFYGIPLGGAEMVHIEYNKEIFPEVVTISDCFDRRDELLVRMGCGLEWSCKRHLDTIYTVYVCRHKPAGQCFNRPIKTFNPPISREQVLEIVGAAQDLAAGRQPGGPTRSLDEMRSQAIQSQGLVREAQPTATAPAANQQRMIQKEAEPMRPNVLRAEDRVNAEAILNPQNRTPRETTPQKGPTQRVTPQKATPKNTSPHKGYNEPWGPNGEKLQKCSKQKRYLPPEDFDINQKTGTYYGHCRKCMGKKN